jgi:Tfp pilus assembly protein PilO
MSIEIILFIIGFILGGGLIWFLRQKELDSVKQNQEELRQVFGAKTISVHRLK